MRAGAMGGNPALCAATTLAGCGMANFSHVLHHLCNMYNSIYLVILFLIEEYLIMLLNRWDNKQ